MSKKKAPSIAVPNDPMEIDQLIHDLGQLDRDLAIEKLAFENAIAPFALMFGKRQKEIADQQALKQKQIQMYCEAHRTDLLPQKDLKTAVFASGTVAWKNRPPSVEFKKGLKVEDVVAAIKSEANLLLYRDDEAKGMAASQALLALIRIKEEVNKEAVLSKPELIENIDALYIRKDVEDFIITPNEIKPPTVEGQVNENA